MSEQQQQCIKPETIKKKRAPRLPGQFRVGKVRADLRGSVWYLSYHEQGQRRRPRVGPDKDVARQLAVQINGQLEVGAPAALSFEPISLVELRERWLARHKHVLRSSVQTIRRYRAATEHLIRDLNTTSSIKARVAHAHKSHGRLRPLPSPLTPGSSPRRAGARGEFMDRP